MRFQSLLLTLVSLITVSGCQTIETKSVSSLEDDFALFLDWFPGRYDSAEQAATDAALNVPEAQRNYRRHSIFRQIELPSFGDTVFLAHQYRDGDPAKVYRQRIYSFVIDLEEGAFRLRVHVPKDAEALVGAYRNPSLLADLIPDDFTVWDGCDLYWRFEVDRFVGRLKPGECRFSSDAFGQDIVLEETLTLMEDQIWFADRGLSLDGRYLFGMRGDVPNISRKVRPFVCQSNGHTAWLHDQGGEAMVSGYLIRLERLSGGELNGLTDQPEGLKLTVPMRGLRDLTVLADKGAETIDLDLGPASLLCRHVPQSIYSEAK